MQGRDVGASSESSSSSSAADDDFGGTDDDATTTGTTTNDDDLQQIAGKHVAETTLGTEEDATRERRALRGARCFCF